MTKPAALQADFTSYKPVPSRKVLQLVFEVPLETQEQTFKVLGYPTPGESTWVAVARLDTKPQAQAEGATAPNKTHSWDTMSRSQRAAVKCGDRGFQIWLCNDHRPQNGRCWPQPGMTATEKADLVLKESLGITSKRELDVPGPKADAFDRLMASYDHRDMVR